VAGGERPERLSAFLYTIGHSTRSIAEFIALLRGFGVDEVADIRTVPRSRHNPQFDQQALAASLQDAGLLYEQMKGLGGLRHARPDSLNRGWRNASFRGFADYMQTDDFAAALADLIAVAEKRCTAIMCAEAVPWRCHRSLVADALVARGYAVEHIMGEGTARPHTFNPGAIIVDGRVRYPPEPVAAAQA
jgi:uncharacterized protein (DUF488 family)